jgi:hypothetical protein
MTISRYYLPDYLLKLNKKATADFVISELSSFEMINETSVYKLTFFNSIKPISASELFFAMLDGTIETPRPFLTN